MSADLVIYAVVAAGLVFWLRSILGTRHGDERERPNPLMPRADAKQPAPAAPEAAAAAFGLAPATNTAEDRITELARKQGGRLSIESRDAEGGLLGIARTERGFDIYAFLENAQDAFALVVEAFAAGDRDTLRNLVAEPVYQAFAAALDERERRGETVATEIHAVRKAAVTAARLDERSRMAFVTIRFTADETCVVRDSEGRIVSGNPDRVTEMADVWTFGRDVRSRDPRWLVYETREGEPEDHKTPMPETSI